VEPAQPQQYLRPGLTLATLQRIAGLMSDTEAARRMQKASTSSMSNCVRQREENNPNSLLLNAKQMRFLRR